MGGVEVLRLSGVKQMVVVKLDKRLEEDYESIDSSTLGHRPFGSLIRNRVTGAIRSKRYASLHDFIDIEYLAHPDIATIYSIYGEISKYVLVEEYLELRLADLFQLTEVEIASATTQIMSGFRHLSESLLAAELDEIRVSLVGRAKIVVHTSPTWVQEQPIGRRVSQYWQTTFMNFFHSMLPQKNGRPFVSYLAHDFLRVSKVAIPSPTHEFLKLSRGADGLVARVKYRYGCFSREAAYRK